MPKVLVICLILCLAILLGTAPARAQAQSNAPADMPKVFLDCVSAYCDTDFLRTDISFVDFVRDRTDADVHVLVTSESTGGGGAKYTLHFIGQKRHAGV